ncbi:MAG TPA: hypothetical protein VL651_06750 [Bacteroidia bacterium]|jgi:hypothetical protein|nr:hypothetical protein [Bacteroidia bacterium]
MSNLSRKFFAAIVFAFLFTATNAQTTVSDTFHVKPIESKIVVTPQKYFLYVNEDNFFRIKYSGKNKMGRVEFRGGTVELKDSVYNLKATTGVSAILVVYEKMKSGKEQILYTWTYKLFSRETPNVYLDGVPNDSFADQFATIALGKLTAKQKYGTDAYRITSFTMYFQNGTHFDTLRSTSNVMTPEMKKRVDAMDVKNKGGMLLFDDIKAVGPKGEMDLPPLRVFLQDGGRIHVGL